MRRAITMLGLFIALLYSGGNTISFAQSSAFTYQGRLNDNGVPANGSYDLSFSLYDDATAGTQQGNTITNLSTTVSNGLFTVTLDFGATNFPGADRWLAIGVRATGPGAFVTLNPRQKITATPYAITAANLSGTLPVSQVAGVIQLGQLPDTIVTNAANAIKFQALHGTVALTVSAKGIANGQSTVANNGADFGVDTPGTTTSGIQEAINALPVAQDVMHPAGGTIMLGPGIFYTTSNIHTPQNTNLYTLDIEGAGFQSCGITYVGTVTQNVMTIGSGRTNAFDYRNPVNFSMRNMWVASQLDGLTNLLMLNGIGGGVWRVNIEMCWFAPWQVMTNYNNFPDLSVHANLIPINVSINYGGDVVTINKCQFYDVAGVFWATDHGSMSDNFFGYCGRNNDWPVDSPFHLGAAITCGELALPNSNEDWSFHRNYFELCNAAYYIGANVAARPVSYEDGFESGGTFVGVLTGGTKWTLINPQIHTPSLVHYLVANNLTLNGSAPASVVQMIDFSKGTFNNGFTFSGPVSATSVSGDGSALTGLSADAVVGGLTTNITVSLGNVTNTLCFTNGVLRAVK